MAAPLLTLTGVGKAFSGRVLFDDINMTIEEDDCMALIGPNGSGKSTLLKIMAGLYEPDNGSVVTRRDLEVAYLPQYQTFDESQSLLEIVMGELAKTKDLEHQQFEWKAYGEATLSRLGFNDPQAKAQGLSGGQMKRLSLAIQLARKPDLLLLDEPTNHLDLEGVLFLEEVLKGLSCPFILVSHDRSFVENLANRVVELSSFYKEGYLSVRGSYSDFVEGKEQYQSYQANEEKALASKVRRELAWLARGARARQTKSQHRIKEAGKLVDDLSDVKLRNNQKLSAALDFSASGRQSRELFLGRGLSKSYGEKVLFKDLDLILSPGMKLGLAGTNGSGKSTLLKIIAGVLEPDKGTVKRAENLKVVWFDQMREGLDQSLTLKEALSPLGDQVEFRGRSMHVASWARRFLFRPEQLPLTLNYLSGGEQARIFIANLMRQPADLLILDEPTNDLDIPTLEVLEESLADFPGAVVLVTHDRYMLDSISTHLLVLGGEKPEYFADYLQWQDLAAAREKERREKVEPALAARKSEGGKEKESEKDRSGKPLSNNEKKELAGLEGRIAEAEAVLALINEKMSAPEIAVNHVKLNEMMKEAEAAKGKIDALYERYTFLSDRAELN